MWGEAAAQVFDSLEPDLFSPDNEFFLFNDFECGESGSARGRIFFVCVMPQGTFGGDIQIFARYDTCQWKNTTAKAFAQDDNVRGHTKMFECKKAPSSP